MSFFFSYPNSPYALPTGSTIDISRVVISPSEPSPISYKITPALPNDVFFNVSNGRITGNAKFSNISVPTIYTVDASYATAVAHSQFTLGINFIPSFTYTDSPYLLEINKALFPPPVTPSFITPTYYIYNTANIVYSITPALPQGLILNTTNGTITGNPIVLSDLIDYVIRANNYGLIYDANLSIGVQTLPTIMYPRSTYILTQGVNISILPIPIIYQIGSNITYSINGCSLPFGLTFNTITGEIAGTPTVLTTFREYTITATNIVGSSSTKLILNVIKEILTTPVLADNFSSNSFLTNPALEMRRKAEILQYKKNSSGLTKNQYLALLAKGNGPYAKRAWGNQGDATSNPNISGLTQNGNTLVCDSPAILYAPTSSSDVPGPVQNLYYNPAIPLIGYNAPTRMKINVGFKWPQRAWSVGDNGFPVGKTGNG